MTYFVLDTIFGFFQMLIIGMYFYKVHGAKNKWLSLCLFPVIGDLVLTATDLLNINQNARVIVNHIAIFLLLVFLFNGKISKKTQHSLSISFSALPAIFLFSPLQAHSEYKTN